jgi:GNAT superfamily N-acetyltransferase
MSNKTNDLEIIEATPKSKKWINEIYNFQVRLYKEKKEKRFIPNLKIDVVGGLGMKGILDHKNPFHKKADVAYFIAKRQGKTVGTIASILSHFHNDFHKEKIGFFGVFEVIEDYDVAKILLDKASSWLKERGMERIRGPFTLDINGISGVLIEGFETKPFLQTAYNFPYYKDFLERYGFVKDKDLYAQLLPIHLKNKEEEAKRQKRINSVSAYIQENNKDLKLLPFNFKNPTKHLEDMKDIFNKSWKDNWGFIPILDEEFKALAESLKLVADRKLALIAYHNGVPISFIVCIPDIYEVTGKYHKLPEIARLLLALMKIKLNRMKRVRVMLFGLVPEYRKLGVDAWIFSQCFKAAQKKRYKETELSWLLEDNELILRTGEKLGAKHYKTWRVFGKPL